MEDTYKKSKGNAGLEGVQFQLDLLIVSTLNALHSHKDWRISTEDKEAGKYDDIAIKLADGTAILIQAKHKDKQKITRELLLSYNSKNSDFSLPKYFFSYFEVKSRFKVKDIIICTNTGVDRKGLEGIIAFHSASLENMLHYVHDNAYFFTINYKILHDLKASAEIYFDKNLQGKGVDKGVLTDENLKEFLDNLQFFPSYPSGGELHGIIEQLLLPRLHNSNSCYKTSYHEIYRKVEDWFKQRKGEYLTETRIKAMLGEIRSNKYCESLKGYNVSFERNDFVFRGSERMFHITTEGDHLLQVLKIYSAMQDDKAEALYVDPDDNLEVQKQVIEALELRRYVFLVIIWTRDTEEALMEAISVKLREILEKYTYKKVILVAEDGTKLTQQIGLEHISQVDGSVRFNDLSKNCRNSLLRNKNILFQGKIVSLKELLRTQISEDYTDSFNSAMLEKLVRGEQIQVGVQPLDLEEDIARYYVSRTFKKDVLMVGKPEETLPEESFYNVEEKVVLMSDGAGMGKSTVLTKLATAIKKTNPHLWVIRINLNDYTKILSNPSIKSRGVISALELLNSQEATKLTNEFERFVFSMEGKVVLMLDGVDEISPDYTDLILSLLNQCQKAPNFAKIFVTTRPHVTREMDAVLKVGFFKMLPFTEDNQISFLTKYWAHNLQMGEDRIKKACGEYAKALINKMSSWVNDCYWQNPFAGIPLQVRMLAEIFQENIWRSESAEWKGCKEYISGDDSEAKLPEKFNIARLYDMFIEKKRNLFMNKANPNGNAMVNEALAEYFNKYLACHRRIALNVILGEVKRNLFPNCLQCEDVKDRVLKIGIVQRLGDEFQFIHRTFAEYFVAESVLKELQLQNQNVEFQKFLIDEILLKPQFIVVRAFLDSFLRKENPSLSINFKNYLSFTYENGLGESTSNKNLIFVLSEEGWVAILRLILNSIDFNVIKCEEISLLDWQVKRKTKKGNPLNDLLTIVHEVGINFRDENGYTPLLSAVVGGHLEMVRFLLEQGANFRSKDAVNRSTLHLASKRGYLDIIKCFVELGEDVNVRDNGGHRALHLAASNGRLDILKYLIERGAKVNIRDRDFRTALHFAAESGYLEGVKYLVEHRADVNVRDSNGKKPLHFSAQWRKLPTVEYFLEHGMDVNVTDNEDRTPLHLAAGMGHLDIVKRLVQHNADVNIKDRNGWTSLHFAAQRGKLNIIQYLLNLGVGVNARNDRGLAALHFAAEAGHLDVTKCLVAQGANINVVNNGGRTALHLAAARGKLETLLYLLEQGINVDVKDNDGRTALHLANGRDIVENLVEHGANINVRSNASWCCLI